MMFFDRNDMISQYEYRSQVNKLQQEKDFYTAEIAIVQKDLKELVEKKVIYKEGVGRGTAYFLI